MRTGVTTPFWESTLRCSLNLQQNFTLNTASTLKFISGLNWWFPPKLVQTPTCGIVILQLQVGRVLTHILWGPAHSPFTHPCVLNPQKDSQMPGTEGMQPHPTLHKAAKVRDRFSRGESRQTFNARKHATLWLSLCRDNIYQIVPSLAEPSTGASPGYRDDLGWGERDCGHKRGESCLVPSLTWKLTCTRKRHVKRECKLPFHFTNKKGEARQTMLLSGPNPFMYTSWGSAVICLLNSSV